MELVRATAAEGLPQLAERQLKFDLVFIDHDKVTRKMRMLLWRKWHWLSGWQCRLVTYAVA